MLLYQTPEIAELSFILWHPFFRRGNEVPLDSERKRFEEITEKLQKTHSIFEIEQAINRYRRMKSNFA